MLPGEFVKPFLGPKDSNQDECRKDDADAHQRQFPYGDEPAKDSRSSRQEDGCVKPYVGAILHTTAYFCSMYIPLVNQSQNIV